MYHRPNAALRLGEGLSLLGVFDESTITYDLSILAKIPDKHVIGSFEALPGLLGHSCVEGLSELQAYLVSYSLLREHLLEGVEVSHLVLDELEGALGAEAAGPQWVAGVGMRPQLTTLRIVLWLTYPTLDGIDE